MAKSDEAHLFVLVHGLWGSPTHMSTIEKAIKRSLSEISEERIITIKPSSNRFWKTYDGIARCAEKVIAEVLYEIETLKQKDNCKVTKISIVGYSLGGLISRYVVGKLYEMNFFEEVKPVVFCTFATPHVGVHFFRESLFDKTANAVGKYILGITGFQLFLADDERLLVRMSDPGSTFFRGLELFERKLLLANIKNDRSVAFYTSFITSHSPFDHWDTLKIKYYKDLPSSKIAGVSVRPKFVDLERSCKVEGTEGSNLNVQEATSLIRRNKILRYTVLFVALSILVPFYIPIVVFLSSCVSVYSILKVKLSRDPGILKHWEEVRKAVFHGGKVNEEHAQQGEDRRKERHKLAKQESFKGDTSYLMEHGLENVLYAESKLHNDQPTVLSENSDEEKVVRGESSQSDSEDPKYSDEDVESSDYSVDKKSSSSMLSSFLKKRNLVEIDTDLNDTIMKTHLEKFSIKDTKQYPLFTEDTQLDISEDQAIIIENLNQLNWEKIAVYHDSFNAHDGIVARRGERTNPKGTSTIYLWASILRNHLST